MARSTTTGPKSEMELADILSAADVALVDSPVSGGVAGAKKGSLALMAAGSATHFAAVEPLLGALGKVIRVAEEPGKAQVMKLINNSCMNFSSLLTRYSNKCVAISNDPAKVMKERVARAK